MGLLPAQPGGGRGASANNQDFGLAQDEGMVGPGFDPLGPGILVVESGRGIDPTMIVMECEQAGPPRAPTRVPRRGDGGIGGRWSQAANGRADW